MKPYRDLIPMNNDGGWIATSDPHLPSENNLTTSPMKKIEINGRVLEYETITNTYEYGEYYETRFYEGYHVVRRKKWFGLFGPVIETKEPNFLFSILEDSRNPNRSKQWWRVEIDKQLSRIERLEEINRDELI